VACFAGPIFSRRCAASVRSRSCASTRARGWEEGEDLRRAASECSARIAHKPKQTRGRLLASASPPIFQRCSPGKHPPPGRGPLSPYAFATLFSPVGRRALKQPRASLNGSPVADPPIGMRQSPWRRWGRQVGRPYLLCPPRSCGPFDPSPHPSAAQDWKRDEALDHFSFRFGPGLWAL